MEWFRRRPRWFRWGLPVAIAIVIAVVLWSRYFRGPEDVVSSRFPFIEVTGVWADSVLGTLTPEEKLEQIRIRVYEKKDTTAHGSGWWFRSDSLNTFQEVASRNPAPEIPVIFGTEGTDPVAETGLQLTSVQILSNRNDSLIFQYLDYHLTQAGKAGMHLVVFPLDLPAVNSLTLRDIRIFNRASKFQGYFNHQALLMGMIPVTPVVAGILPSSDKSKLTDSIRFNAVRKIYHRQVPAILLDSLPAAFRNTGALRKFFRDTFGFQGIVIVRRENIPPDELTALVQAGADLVITSGKTRIQTLPDEGSLNRAAGNVLCIKEWLRKQPGIRSAKEPVPADSAVAVRLQYNLLTGSVVRVQDPDLLIPIRKAGRDPLLLYLPAGKKYEAFQEYLKNFTDVTVKSYTDPGVVKPGIIRNALWVAEDSVALRKLVSRGDAMRGNIVVYAGHPAGLASVTGPAAVLWVSDFRSELQQITANFIFGGTSCDGTIPVTVAGHSLSGRGLAGFKPEKLNYTIPEDAGIHPATLLLIDSIIAEAISNGAFPGCQVFAALDGKVILHKAFGHLTYEPGSARVTTRHLYDVASLTEALATTTGVMKLYEKGRIRLSDKLGRYFKDRSIDPGLAVRDTLIREDTLVLKGSRGRKAAGHGSYRRLNDTLFLVTDTLYYAFQQRRTIFDLSVSSLLTHTSGLPPGLPVTRFMVPQGSFQNPNQRAEFYALNYHPDSAFVQVAEGLYLRTRYRDTLWSICKALGINEKAGFVHSGVNMMLLQLAMDSLTRKRMPVFLQDEIYGPLGLKFTGFNPLARYGKDAIVPTALDLRWRKQLLQGTVHDPASALFGGISGSSGLFSTAGELGIIGQMLLDSGSYGGRKIFEPSTVALFTSRQAGVAYGLGFDTGNRAGMAAPSASPNTYGHTGFTGSVIWIDPDNRLVFVFLSNRVHPNPENQKINYLKVPEKVHEALYQGIRTGI
ncbi:MAG TPA: serine hydrolase [Bacteroidales bacterium]|nr:serine hydrolase [Bacteroidales bacterium]HRZ48315.1 serine hydrolase [Bacteroidales bacterium]